MRKIALYGKGGIGKSTIASNITASLSEKGYKVMQLGCDPKADSTELLHKGKKAPTILDAIKENIPVSDAIVRGYKDCLCAECGGPRPGTGCAGRGIMAAFEHLEKEGIMEDLSPDVLIYDVLGDVVCGGFAMPIREGYAKDVFIVSSGEMMSIYAAGNIAMAVQDLRSSGYAELKGMIQNSRAIENEDAILDRAASEIGTSIVGRMPRDGVVQKCEEMGVTVVEGAPGSEMASSYRDLADVVLSMSTDCRDGMRHRSNIFQ